MRLSQSMGSKWSCRGWSHELPRERRRSLPIKPLSALYLNLPCSPRYRKVVSNVCEGGVDLQQSPVQLQCPLTAPRGLQVSIRGEAVAVRPKEDVLFVVRQEQVSITPDCHQKGSSSQAPKGRVPDSLEYGHRGLSGPEGGATRPKLASWSRRAF